MSHLQLLKIMKDEENQFSKHRKSLYKHEYDTNWEYLKSSMRLLLERVMRAGNEKVLFLFPLIFNQLQELLHRDTESKVKLPLLFDGLSSLLADDLFKKIDSASLKEVQQVAIQMKIIESEDHMLDFNWVMKYDEYVEKIKTQLLKLTEQKKQLMYSIDSIHDALPPPFEEKDLSETSQCSAFIRKEHIKTRVTIIDKIIEITEIGIRGDGLFVWQSIDTENLFKSTPSRISSNYSGMTQQKRRNKKGRL